MGRVQNLRESSMNVISRFTICVNCELCEWWFSLFLEIMIEKSDNSWVISRESAKITETRHSIFLGFKMKPAGLIRGIFQIFLMTKFNFTYSFLKQTTYIKDRINNAVWMKLLFDIKVWFYQETRTVFWA